MTDGPIIRWTCLYVTQQGLEDDTRRDEKRYPVVTRGPTPKRRKRPWLESTPLSSARPTSRGVGVGNISPTQSRKKARSAVGISSWVCRCAISQDVFARMLEQTNEAPSED
ncbi:hypothetical protein CORC01_13512 [Colletotrichum orchidophilum]|uniref:Uncharacterized protein n=1 Tax=Colletotrichum orchidophilum TaxID=1209926 RepID=A0A1G4AQ25_9PEZI|nr:uncharacterized protein CORC01_13512 [Colletotrichum orchidophilum]OHE91201.1 hypothetical protein CORC01_13512 [Colletotrichum orchidophilum]